MKVLFGGLAALGVLAAPVPGLAASAVPASARAGVDSRIAGGHSVLATADVKDEDHLVPLLIVLIVVVAAAAATVAVVELSGSGGA